MTTRQTLIQILTYKAGSSDNINIKEVYLFYFLESIGIAKMGNTDNVKDKTEFKFFLKGKWGRTVYIAY